MTVLLARGRLRALVALLAILVVAVVSLLWLRSGDPAQGDDVRTGFDTAMPPVPAKDASRQEPPFVPPAHKRVVPTETGPPAPASGPETDSCVWGWVTPEAGSSDFQEPLDVIRRTVPVKGEFVVVDMRMFQGPEVSGGPEEEGSRAARRWYVKLYVDGKEERYQGRFIVGLRLLGSGVEAVAAYDTSGVESPDWVGFQFNAPDRDPKKYPGLPGRWRGMPYDFVTGGNGILFPGVPDEVAGCLDGV